ncbi:sigma-70 family RNA polymerase sigma factor [Lachnospiraceae bacterium LCP25S3_G4]
MSIRSQYEGKSNEELLMEYQNTKSIEIKQELVMRYIYIVKSISLQMRNVYLGFAQLDDIVNEGVLAIMNAIDKFNIDKNVKFETYISKRIRGMIIDLARKQDWVPRSVRKNAKDIDQATMQLYHQLGRYPEQREVANYLNISIDKYQEIVGNTSLFNILSLDVVLEEANENKKSVQLTSPNHTQQPEQHILNEEIRKMIVSGIESLRENEKTVISLYYIEELNMKDIAKVMQVSEPRISQIHANAIRKLKLYLESSMKS